MPKTNDLTGKIFNRLTVLGPDLESKSKNRRWLCQCQCGTIKSIQGSNLISGGTQSCGCLHKEKVTTSYIGKKFGKLTVIADSGKRLPNRGIIWTCQCDCGTVCEISGTSLQQKFTFSCGCLKQSHGEYIIEQLLKEYEISYQKEYVFKDLKTPKGGYSRFDFAIFHDDGTLSHLIEYDGETHSLDYVRGWNTEEKIKYQQQCDALKDEYCLNNNIQLIRIPYTQQNITIADLLV